MIIKKKCFKIDLQEKTYSKLQSKMEVQQQNQNGRLVDNDNFRNLFPDTFDGFINYITQDENGGIMQDHSRFNEALHTIYYHMTPEEFCNQYENFVNTLRPQERFYRNFLHGHNYETTENCIKRIYNKTQGSHADPQDIRDPRFIFVLNTWLELWR